MQKLLYLSNFSIPFNILWGIWKIPIICKCINYLLIFFHFFKFINLKINVSRIHVFVLKLLLPTVFLDLLNEIGYVVFHKGFRHPPSIPSFVFIDFYILFLNFVKASVNTLIPRLGNIMRLS